MSKVTCKNLKIYVTTNNKQPFVDWLESFKDLKLKARISERLSRLMLGNFGDYKKLPGGISELRLKFGSEYRIYFAEDGNDIVLLLCAGDKKTQARDIKTAITFWKDYCNE